MKNSKAKDILDKSTPVKNQAKQYRQLDESNYLAEKRGLEIKALKDYFSLREKWSKHILRAFWLILTFGITFIFLLGFNILNYSQYSTFPSFVVTSFIATIIGIPIIIAKFLFPDSSSKK